MKVTITQIVDSTHEGIPVICQWLQKWWGDNENFSARKMETYVKNSLCHTRIPQTYFMEVDGIPAGMFQFSMTDIEVRPDIYPWLINVYIDTRFRGKGLFHFLMAQVKGCAAALGLKELYLFTKHEELYEKFGWEFVEVFDTFQEPDDLQRLYRWRIQGDELESSSRIT